MAKVITLVLSLLIIVTFVSQVQADGCYICESGKYVKYKGDDKENKRRDAATCGCRVMGTMNPCKVKADKILCSVKNETLAQEKPVVTDPKKKVKN